MTILPIKHLAVLIPARNEAGSLKTLLPELDDALRYSGAQRASVYIFDDASSDGTAEVVKGASLTSAQLFLLQSRVRVGKAFGLQQAMRSALEAGADGLLMMDGDGQDNPAHIREIVAALDSGTDLVNARRLNREHSAGKRLSSRAFNASVRLITGLKVWDINSGMKGFSRRAAEQLAPYLYGELHRVLLVIAVSLGFTVGEVAVTNRPRTAGSSKYGITRGWKGLLDLVTVQFLIRFRSRPGHFFSGVGAVLVFTAFIAWALSFFALATGDEWEPMLYFLLPTLVILGIVLISIGFLSELVLFLSQGPPTQVVDLTRVQTSRRRR
jgi:glycosyltransferase involved in cell wall biosynthesis